MSRRKRYRTGAIDTLSARITQAEAAVLALRCTYGDRKGDDTRMANDQVTNMLWAISELLGQAQEAFDKMSAELTAEHQKNNPPRDDTAREDRAHAKNVCHLE